MVTFGCKKSKASIGWPPCKESVFLVVWTACATYESLNICHTSTSTKIQQEQRLRFEKMSDFTLKPSVLQYTQLLQSLGKTKVRKGGWAKGPSITESFGSYWRFWKKYEVGEMGHTSNTLLCTRVCMNKVNKMWFSHVFTIYYILQMALAKW